MSEDPEWKKTSEKINSFVKGNKMYAATTGHNYTIKFKTSPSASCKVSVIQKATATSKKIPVLRFDQAHKGVPYNHININPKISGIPDPHLELPTGGLNAGKGVAKFCQTMNKINKVAVPVAIAVDLATTGYSVYKDIQNGTTRGTIETVASSAGGWGGGYGGAVGGAALGTALLPGVGTIIGGIIGAISGGIAGSIGASAIASEIGDVLDYDVIEVECKFCDRKFKIRKYKGEDYRNICDKCFYLLEENLKNEKIS